MVGKTAMNKERYHLNGGPFQTFKANQNNYKSATYKGLAKIKEITIRA